MSRKQREHTKRQQQLWRAMWQHYGMVHAYDKAAKAEQALVEYNRRIASLRAA